MISGKGFIKVKREIEVELVLKRNAGGYEAVIKLTEAY